MAHACLPRKIEWSRQGSASQLDGQPRDLPRLVPADAQGGPHSFPGPGAEPLQHFLLGYWLMKVVHVQVCRYRINAVGCCTLQQLGLVLTMLILYCSLFWHN